LCFGRRHPISRRREPASHCHLIGTSWEVEDVRIVNVCIGTSVKGLLFSDIMWWFRWVEPSDCSLLIMPQESHLHSTTQQQSIETKERGESGVDQSEARRTRCVCYGREVRNCTIQIKQQILSIWRIHLTQQHTKDITTCL
jgi:hypothetical protein